MERGNRR